MRQKRLYAMSVVLALGLALLPPAIPPAKAAGTYTVNTTSDRNSTCGDEGLCSLREAINMANSNPGADAIAFNISGCAGGVCTLTINASYGPLPPSQDTSGGTTIDGTTDSDTIEINCSNSNAACLRVNSASNTIKGLVINRCPWAGVLISGTGTDYNKVLGCYIGTDATGELDLHNRESGVVITGGAAHNQIGGSGNGNVISANWEDGVWIYGEGTDDNSVTYNYIGTDKDGETNLGNQSNGIYISNNADNNKIGSISGGGNVIAGNKGSGIRIAAADGNQIMGNYIGIDKGGDTDLGNGGDGVQISNGAWGNTVGGDIVEERNVISGNEGYGVYVNDADNNTVSSNYIGTDESGTSALGNRYAGVLIANGSTNNTIGGDTEAEKNVISGNGVAGSWDGVEVNDSDANTVQGNYIGLRDNGYVALANSGNGVAVSGGSNVVKDNVISGNSDHGLYINGPNTQVTGNIIGLHKDGGSAVANGGCGIYVSSGDGSIIGGRASGDHNTIAGNDEHGVVISSTTGIISGTVIMGNYIGTNQLNWSWVGNGGVGVYLSGQVQYSTIGGDEAGEENVISGNGSSGVVIEGNSACYNTVSRNYIGLNSSGSSKLSNGQHGVEIRVGASYNTLGGNGDNQRNYIGGSEYGVAIYTHSDIQRPHNNQVTGNYIGTNASGADLSNSIGVAIYDYAHHNTVADNFISRNTQYGVYLSGSEVYENAVQGNYIGVNASGTAKLANGGSGVYIGGSARDNRIGGTMAAERNIISGNSQYGIRITGSNTRSNDVWGNYIGTNAGDANLGNTSHGIYLDSGARTNVIGPGNVIAFNGGDGVRVDGNTTLYNTITATQIYTNTLLGIQNINGGNIELTRPVIIGTNPITGTACANCVVQVFSDDEDEGRIYHGSTTADATGHFTYTNSVSGPYVTATATDSWGNTSEFSDPVATEGSGPGPGSGGIYLPIITKNYP